MASVLQVTSEVNANGELVVHCQGTGDEVYRMTTIPSANMSLVRTAEGQILMDLHLQSVVTNLNRASDLLFLTYLGVVGTGDLHARISNRQKEWTDLCIECQMTMTALVRSSQDVVNRMTEAYELLLEAEEFRALQILSTCAESAKTMASKCGTLALGFKKLKDDTKEDAATAARALGSQVEKNKELKNRRDDMKATKAKQEKLTEEYNKMIKDREDRIRKLEAREDAADKRAFVGRVMGSMVIGMGVAAELTLGSPGIATAGMAMRMIDGGVSALTEQYQTANRTMNRGQNPSAEPQSILEADIATAEKSLEEAKSAKEAAASKATELRGKVFDAGVDKRLKDQLLKLSEAADATDPGYENKKREATAALEASAASLRTLEEEYKQAEKMAIDGTTALAFAAGTLATLMEGLSVQQADQAAAESFMGLLQQKLDIERNRLESVKEVAELTARLGSTEYETQVKESAQIALEIAAWALDSIYILLLDAKGYWDRKTTFCEELAESNVLKRVKEETEYNAGKPEERKKFYKSKGFVKEAVTHLARWVALETLCKNCVDASSKAKQSVFNHIKASPNEKEARELIVELKARLNDEFQQDVANSGTKIHELERIQEDAKMMFENPTA